MKKKNILNLIKYHVEDNNEGFLAEAQEVARYFDKVGDYQLSEYIMAKLANTNTFFPQTEENKLTNFKKIDASNSQFFIPDAIQENLIGIVNASKHNVGVNKFLFEGPPGTGKTETAKQLARIMDRELYMVDFSSIVDSKLGQTAKNIVKLFEDIELLIQPEKVIILFDEIDAIAIDRINNNDLREMGRATSTILKGLDSLNDKVVLIATTNLYNSFDKALVRRFDSVVNFSQYSREDLIDIAESVLNSLLYKFKTAGRNMRLFKKIINMMDVVPYPGELINLIRSSLAFSDPKQEFDYLKRLFKAVNKNKKDWELRELKDAGFTLREIEILTDVSRSQVSRELKE